MPSCRSCGKSIIWTVTRATGKKMPVDAQPAADGNVVLEQEGETAYSRTLSRVAIEGAIRQARSKGTVLELRHSHFTTCRNARAHRKQ